ncbi:MAG TPA: hypothetical protein VLJ76_01680 [Gaiellaceae bacterium]|nr:hypothetical protein [Gaiellaceae bacterium]
MKWALNHRPSPALVIALLALVIAASGTAVAASTALVSGDSLIQKNSLSGNRLKNHTVTGVQVNLAKLGKVPSAKAADSAKTAGSATNANHATSADSATHATNADNATNATAAGHAGNADGLTNLPSGQSESGAFSGAGGSSASGYYGFGVTYARPLATAIADSNIVDTSVNPDPTHCPGPGHAAAGYLCLYFQYHSNTGTVYGYSTDSPYSAVSPSIGVGFYAPISGAGSYANGVWTVTAP